MKVYISGPQGKKDGKPEGISADMLEAIVKLKGVEIVPAWLPNWSSKKDKLHLLIACESIYMLEGWEKSREATLERNVALHLGMFISYVLDESYFEDDSYSENQLDLLDAC